jgi:hypothetical protein
MDSVHISDMLSGIFNGLEYSIINYQVRSSLQNTIVNGLEYSIVECSLESQIVHI